MGARAVGMKVRNVYSRETASRKFDLLGSVHKIVVQSGIVLTLPLRDTCAVYYKQVRYTCGCCQCAGNAELLSLASRGYIADLKQDHV